MAFKQSSNPLSRNNSPMRRSPFRQQQTMTMDELNKATAAAEEQSRINSQSGTAGAPGDPGTEINYDDPRKFAGDDEGMLQSNFEPQFPGDDGYEDQGMSRESSDKKRLQRKLDRMGKKNSNTADVSDGREEVNEFIQDNGRPGQKRRAQKLNDKVNPSYQGVAPIKGMSDEEARSIDEDTYPDGLSRKTFPKPIIPMDEPYGLSRKASPLNDKTSRKIKKGNKTAKQIVEMQNKRSSYKKTYLGDPDDLEGEMVRTADKPASKREGRKIKKLKKTEKQLGISRKASPLNGLNDMDGYGGDDSDTNKEETVTKQDNSRSAIKDRKAKDKAKGVSKPQMRANKAKSKSAAAAEKAKTVKNPDYKKQLEAKSERLAKRAKRKEGRADRKANNKANRQANKKSREDSKK